MRRRDLRHIAYVIDAYLRELAGGCPTTHDPMRTVYDAGEGRRLEPQGPAQSSRADAPRTRTAPRRCLSARALTGGR